MVSSTYEFKNTRNSFYINKSILIFLFFLLIIIGKVVRYTIMKNTLADVGIGHAWIDDILNGNVSFDFFSFESSRGTNSSDNAAFLFYWILYPFLDFIKDYYSIELFISIIWNIIVFLMVLKFKDNLSMYELSLSIICIVCLNIFDFTLSKEPIQFLIFFCLFLAIKSNLNYLKKNVLIALIVILSALLFRTYNILIIYYYFVINIIIIFYRKLLSKLAIKKFLITIIILVAIILAQYLLMFFVRNISVQYYNLLFTVGTSQSYEEANTLIKRMYENTNSLFYYLIDYFFVYFRLLFPVELFRLGLKYSIYVIIQLIISIYVIKTILCFKRISINRRISIILFMSFVAMSACFEPDFGSWIRHEIAITPIIFILGGLFKENGEYDYSHNKIV